ncbi:hypothetical protein VTJ04DRAFT_6625 [Mycothermus thermophilus]|uniref:uncharacterized protein n=1 Tax=Humicola insolens TaxID=85995 RepID=UPI0037443470
MLVMFTALLATLEGHMEGVCRRIAARELTVREKAGLGSKATTEDEAKGDGGVRRLLVGTPSLQAGWQPALSSRCYPKASRPLDGLKLPESNKQKGHKLHVCHVIHFPSECTE